MWISFWFIIIMVFILKQINNNICLQEHLWHVLWFDVDKESVAER